jgi:hypothetical protein
MEAIFSKLQIFDVTGPHTLHFLTNDDLHKDGGFSAAQVADICDAEYQWCNKNNPLTDNFDNWDQEHV